MKRVLALLRTLLLFALAGCPDNYRTAVSPVHAPISPSFLGRIASSGGRAYAFHRSGNEWITALHAVHHEEGRADLAALQLDGVEREIPCRLVAASQRDDLGLLDCPGTEAAQVLDMVSAPQILGSEYLLEVAYLDPQAPGTVLRRQIRTTRIEYGVSECNLEAPAILLADAPAPGDSGAPLIARLRSGKDALFGMWVGVWSSATSETAVPTTYGIAVGIASLRELATARSSAVVHSGGKSFSCAPHSVSSPDIVAICGDAYRTAARSPAGEMALPAVCSRLPDTIKRKLSADGRAEHVAFESALGPAAWVLSVDAAFAGQISAMHYAVNRSEALASIWERVHGDGLASAFEYEAFEAALETLRAATGRDAALRVQVENFGLDPSQLGMSELLRAMALSGKTLKDSPLWMYCALASGAQRLSWTSSVEPNLFEGCMLRTNAWIQLASRATAILSTAHCDGAVTSSNLGDQRWPTILHSPRAQVALWLALEQLGVLQLDRAFARRLGVAPNVDFGATMADLRARVATLLKDGDVLSRVVMNAANTLSDMLGPSGSNKLSDFLSTNICRVPKSQQRNRGVSRDYFTAIDTIRTAVCDARGASPAIDVGDWCSTAQRTEPIATRLAGPEERFASNWLHTYGFGDWFSSVAIKSEVLPGASSPMFWVILNVEPSRADRIANYWFAVDAKLAAAEIRGIATQLGDALAAFMGVRREDVAIYRNTYCNDLRVRFFRGEKPKEFSVKCTARHESYEEAHKAELDAIVRRFVLATVKPERVTVGDHWSVRDAVERALDAASQQQDSSGELKVRSVTPQGDPMGCIVSESCSVGYSFVAHVAYLSNSNVWWVKSDAELSITRTSASEGHSAYYEVKYSSFTDRVASNTTGDVPDPDLFDDGPNDKIAPWFRAFRGNVVAKLQSESSDASAR